MSRFSTASAALCAILGCALSARAARAQDARVVGTFYTVWGDPRASAGPPLTQHVLHGADGGVRRLAIPPEVLAAHGGPEALWGGRVLATGEDEGVAGRSQGADGPMLRVRALERLAEPMPRAPAAAAGGGEARPYVTLLCRFPDFSGVDPGPRSTIDRAFGASYPGVAHFWGETSGGRVDMSGGAVHGWYLLPEPRSRYVPGDFADLTALARDCAAAADDDVHFPDFAGVNLLFNTDVGCCSWGGAGLISADGVARSYPMTWLASSDVTANGRAAHEVGHSFGLGHSSGSYGFTYDSMWDVMSIGAWHTDPATGHMVGAHTNAHHKRRLGWIDDDRLLVLEAGVHTVWLELSAASGSGPHPRMIELPTPAYGPGERYTLEARGGRGYDAPLPGEGIVVHRIGGGGATGSNALDLDGNGDVSDRGAVVEVGERFQDRANGIEVSVEERHGDAFRLIVRVADYPRIRLAASSAARAFVAGAVDVLADTVSVVVRGMDPSARWSAALRSAGPFRLSRTEGSGDGAVVITFDPRGVGAGVYHQAIRVWGEGARAELDYRVTVEPATTLTAGLLFTSARDSAVVGVERGGFTATALSGPSADSADWSFAARAPWIRVETTSGRGNRYLSWVRSAHGLAPGVYVDTLRLDVPGAHGSPVELVDSFLVRPVPTLSLSRSSARGQARQGGFPAADSVWVTVGGDGQGAPRWSALLSGYPNHVRGTPPPEPGSGWFRYQRYPLELAPGIHVDTVTVYSTFAPAVTVSFVDTLEIVPAASALRLSAPSRWDTVYGPFVESRDSVWVQVEGPASTGRAWRAHAVPSRLVLLGHGVPGWGTGSGWLRWIRSLAAREPGVHVDTIRVDFASGAGAGALLVDTLHYLGVTALDPVLSLSETGRRATLPAGAGEQVTDSVDVVLQGRGADTVTWSATASAPWLALHTPTGVGPGRIRWSRSPAGLPAGTHLDTIHVGALGGALRARLVDTLTVVPGLAIVTDPALPPALMGAPYAAELLATGGASPDLRWRVVAGEAPPGLALDSLQGRLHGVAEAAGEHTFSVEVSDGVDAVRLELALRVGKPALALVVLLDQLLEVATRLGPNELRFLDLLGNRNGRLDVADVGAWLADQGLLEPGAPSAADPRSVGGPTR